MHSHFCKHEKVVFCKKCDVPYCEECGKEWAEKCMLSHSLWTYPYYDITPDCPCYTANTSWDVNLTTCVHSK